MGQAQELRIGICGCTSVYTGRLADRIISLGRVRFRLKEIPVDDSDPLRDIYSKRCHFFLDVHRVSVNGVDKFNTFIVRYEASHPKRKAHPVTVAEADEYLEMTRKMPARVSHIENWILDLMAPLTDYERRKWLILMR